MDNSKMSGMRILVMLMLMLVGVSARWMREDTRRTKGDQYLWKSGKWGSCYPTFGSCGDGTQRRSIWCAHVDGHAVLEFDCNKGIKPATDAACFVECSFIEEFRWDVSGWSLCQILPTGPKFSQNANDGSKPARVRENLGVMQRNVTCVLVLPEAWAQRVVDDASCLKENIKPESMRICKVPQPQDCVVGAFSEWSACQEPIDCEYGGANQTRVRTIFVAPMFSGTPCPPLVESRPCEKPPACDEGRGEYYIKVGDWRLCQAPGSIVPADVRDSRHRGHNGGRSHHMYNTPDFLKLVPNHFNRLSLTSSTMTAEELDTYYTYKPDVGYQTREVSCRDSKGVAVDLSLCLRGRVQDLLPPTVQPCVVPEDCVVNQWSEWNTLQKGCLDNSGKAARPAVEVRRRQIVRLNHGEGKPCPRLKERRVVTDPEQLPSCIETYRWLASQWSHCMLMGNKDMTEVGCGGGVQVRDVACVMITGSQPVNSELCSMFVPLPTVQRCEVACPRDCLVNSWAAWGKCQPYECAPGSYWPTQGYRERRRSIRVTSSDQGVQCPSVREVQSCEEASCVVWVEAQWSPCQLIADQRRCGEGRRSRNVNCRTTTGLVVEDALCERVVKKPPTKEVCLQPCPFDCVVSPWSDWSPCSHSCTSSDQVALRQRNRTIIAPPGIEGYPCPDPDEMLQIDQCNTHSCRGYSWLTLPWQPCIPVSYTAVPAMRPTNTKANGSTNDEGCGTGLETREVWCMEANEHRTEDHRCYPLSKPETTRPCKLGCVINCTLSPWSEWNTCPTDCDPVPPNPKKVVTPVQVRRRMMIQAPELGGIECGPLEDIRPCPMPGARCLRFSWGFGEWSDCELPNNIECGVGYRIRAVWCHPSHRRNKVQPGLCTEHNASIPATSEPCYTDCTWPCVLSTWSEWSPCTYTCSASQRTRQLIGLSSTRPSCTDPKRFPLIETKSCPCNKYELRTLGNWSQCILDTEITSLTANGRPARGICGKGSKYRRVGCFNTTGHIMQPTLCGAESGLEEDSCLIPCPVDCELTEWGAWQECSTLCGPGIHNRTRKVIHEPTFDGRPCEDIIQLKVCDLPCNQFSWVAGGWSECQLIEADEERGCGTGDQYRQVRCMKVTINVVAVEMPDAYCDPSEQPADVNACHVVCPGDCVVSPWSDWSLCAKPCDVNKQRQRTRTILRKPAKSEYLRPPLIEVQSCVINITCFIYNWQKTILRSCLPLGGSPCGEGLRSTAVFCIRSDGRIVEERLCENNGRPLLANRWCYVDCTVDCEVTEWGSWDHSGCHCGSANSAMTRYRYMMTNNSPTGRPCPKDMVQHKPCPVVPCYTWDRGPWSECKLDGAWCGHGTVTRNITCLRDGEPVEKRLCENAPDLHTTDKCYVPCKGDCQVSEWSHWSHCHRNCQSSSNDGYQTRSRAVLRQPSPEGEICPTTLWETRSCYSGACLTFDWVIAPGGKITCQRSDGVIVTGGCENRPIPCSNPRCETVPHAYCDTTLGTCICESGYYAHLAKNQQLTKCIPASENEPNSGNKVRYDGELAGAPDEIHSQYYYPRDQINGWMLAVIGIGCVFVIFVAVSVYIMCNKHGGNPGLRLPQQTQEQQALTVRPAAQA